MRARLRRLAATLAPLLLLGGGRAVAALGGFLAAGLLARRVDAVTLGLFAMALAVQGHAAQLAELGLRSWITALAGIDPARARAFLSRYLALRLAAALALGAATAAAAPWLLPADPVPLYLVLAALPLMALHLDWAALATGRAAEAAMLVALRPLLWASLLALVVPAGSDPATLAGFWLAAWAGAVLAALPALRHLPPARGPAPAPAAALQQALPLGLSALAGQLQLGLDLYLVGRLLGPAAAGTYWLAGAVAVAALVLANAGQQWTLARLAAAAAAPGGLAPALRHHLLLLGAVGLVAALGLALLAPPLVPLAFGPDHGAVAALLPWFAPWLALRHPVGVLQSARAARREGHRLLLADLASLAALATALVPALLLESPHLAALARAAAEAARLAVLAAGIRPGGLRWRDPPPAPGRSAAAGRAVPSP